MPSACAKKFSPLRIFKPASRMYDSGAQACARLTKMPENTTCKHSAQQTTDSLSVLSPRCNRRVNHPKTARFEGGSSSGVLTQKTNESNIYVCWESNGRKVGAITALCDLRWCRPSWVRCRSIEGRLWVDLLWCPLVESMPAAQSSSSDAAVQQLSATCGSDTWLILPVVICLSQRLSHACLSTSPRMVKPRMAHYNSHSLLDLTFLLG
jgi:hypothetical protein